MPASLGPVWSGGGGSSSHDGTLSPDADGLLNKAGDHDSSAKTAAKTAASSFLVAARCMLSSANPRSETYAHKSTPVIEVFFFFCIPINHFRLVISLLSLYHIISSDSGVL